MIERLTPLDAAFLDAEDEDRHASMAIASVAVFEGPPPSHEELVADVRGKLPLVPRYRQKLRTVPFDLGQPVWVDDPGFDIRYHVRRTALPAPGDDEALCRLVARLMSQRLDRERPLWECWVVEGLRDGRWAMVSKVHHCMADGIAGTNIYNTLFDASPEPRAPVEDGWAPAAEPSTLRLTAGALRDLLLVERPDRAPPPVRHRSGVDGRRGRRREESPGEHERRHAGRDQRRVPQPVARAGRAPRRAHGPVVGAGRCPHPEQRDRQRGRLRQPDLADAGVPADTHRRSGRAAGRRTRAPGRAQGKPGGRGRRGDDDAR